jgi:hypothetical protein
MPLEFSLRVADHAIGQLKRWSHVPTACHATDDKAGNTATWAKELWHLIKPKDLEGRLPVPVT